MIENYSFKKYLKFEILKIKFKKEFKKKMKMGVLKIKFENCNFGKVFGNGNFENWNFGELNLGIEVLKIKSKNYLRIEVLKIKFKNWNFEKLFENGNLGKLFLKSKKKNDTWLLWLHAKGGHA